MALILIQFNTKTRNIMAVCTTILPVASADACEPNVHWGGITEIRYTRPEATDGLTDSSDAAEWADRLSNSDPLTVSGTPAPIRYLYVKGEWPLPEVSEVEASGGRTVSSEPKHTLTLDITDTSDANAAMVATEAGQTRTRKVWIVAGGQLFGGDDGMDMDVTFLGRVIPGSKSELQSFRVKLVYTKVPPAPIDLPV